MKKRSHSIKKRPLAQIMKGVTRGDQINSIISFFGTQLHPPPEETEYIPLASLNSSSFGCLPWDSSDPSTALPSSKPKSQQHFNS